MNAHLASARASLEAAALKYARLKAFGMRLDSSGGWCKPCSTDLPGLLDVAAYELQQAALFLAAEMTLTEPEQPTQGKEERT